MEKLINDADIFHNDDDKLRGYNDKLNDWRNENDEKVTGSQLLSAIQVLNKKLTQSKCPTYDTEGWTQAWDIYDDFIRRIAGELIDNNKVQPEDLRWAYYNLYIEWLKYGPATVQLEIMKETVSDSNIEMEEFMKKLTGEPRTKLISAIMTPITKKEDTKDEEFYENHRTGMKRFIDSAFDKSSLLEKNTMKLWLDYSFHLYLDYLHLGDDAIGHLIREADDRFEDIEDGWESFSDVNSLKSLIEKLIKATKSQGFPRNQESANSFYGAVSKLCNKLKQPGDAETYCDSMFDLLEALSVCKGNRKELLEVFWKVLRFFYDQDSDIIKKRIPFFKAVVPRFKALLPKLDMDILQQSRFCTVIVDKLEYSYANNKTLVTDWVSLVVPLLRRPCYDALRAAYSVLSKDDQIRWKDHKEVANEAFKCFTQVQLPSDENEENKKIINEYTSCIGSFIRGLEKSRILKEFGEGMMFLAINLLELKLNTKEMFGLIEKIGEHIEINVTEKRENVMEVMKRIHLILRDENMPWNESWPLQRAVDDTINSIIRPVNDGRIFTDDDLKVFTSMCHTCLSKDILNPSDSSFSAHFIIAKSIMDKLIGWMASTKRLGYAIKLIPLLLSKYEEDEEKVYVYCGRYLDDFATGEAATMTPYLEQLIKIYLDKEDSNILSPINTTYPFNPKPMKEYFQVLLHQLLDTIELKVSRWLTHIFWTASKKQPELFTEQNMKDIIQMAKMMKQIRLCIYK